MPSVDNRIVHMLFDNKDFEQDVNTSISSLDKLKSSLDFGGASKGFDELGKATDAVSVKFSSLNSIADQFFRLVTTEVYGLKNKFVGLVKSMSLDQVTEGMTKYEQKTSSVQTILNSTGKSLDDVNGYLERLMTYSDETSFGFTDMTSALQTMTASGGDLEKLVPMLMGMGNAVAFAGKGAAEFSRVMTYGLNQAYSIGYLGTKDWMTFSGAGVNSKQLQQTLLDVVREQKKGDYALEQFGEALTKKAIDKEVMEEAFGRFAAVTLEAEKLVNEGRFDTFSAAYEYLEKTDFAKLYNGIAMKAARAGQEAKTFKEAIDATKDAVSSGWMTTFEKLIGDYDHARQNFTWLANELWDVFASGGNARNDMLEAWSQAGGYDKLWASIKNVWDGLRGIGSKIVDAWNRVFPSLDTEKLLEITDRLYAFSTKFKNRFAVIEEAIDELSETINTKLPKITNALGFSLFNDDPNDASEFAEYVGEVDENVRKLATTLEHLDELTSAVTSGKYGSGEDRRKRLEEEGYSYELIQNAVNEAYGATYRYAIADEDLAKAQGYLNEELSTSTKSLAELKAESHAAYEETKKLKWIDDLRDVLGGFKSALDLVIEAGKLVTKYIVVPAWNKLVSFFKSSLATVAPFSRAFSEFVENLKSAGTVTNNIDSIINWFKDLKNYLKGQENFKVFLNYLGLFKEKTEEVKSSALDRVINIFEKIVDFKIKLPPVEDIGTWIDNGFYYVDKIIEFFVNFKDIFTKIKDFFANVNFDDNMNVLSDFFDNISIKLSSEDTTKKVGEIAKGWIHTILTGVIGELKEIDLGFVLSSVLKIALIKGIIDLAEVPKALSDVLWGLWGALQGLKINLIGKGLLSIASAIGILAASLVVLSLIPEDKLEKSISGLLTIAVAVTLITKLLTLGDKQSFANISKLGTYFVGLGIAAVLISLAIKKLSKINDKDLYKAIGAVGLIMVIMTVVLVLMSSLKSISNANGMKMSGFIGIATSFILLSVAIDLIMPAIAILTGLAALPNNLLLKAVGFMSMIILIFTAFFAMMELISHISGKSTVSGITGMISSAIAFAALSIALDLMIPAISALTGLALIKDNALMKAVTVIGSIMLMFSLMSLFFKSGTNLNLLPVAVAFVAVAFAMSILTTAIAALSLAAGKTTLGNYIATIISIVVILGSLVGAIYLLSKIKIESLGSITKALLAVSLAVAIIGVVLKNLSGTSFKDLISIVGPILIFVAALTILGAIVGKFTFIADGIAILGVAIGVFGAGILLAGLGALAFAKALQILSDASVNAKDAGRNLAEGVVAFFDELVAHGQSIITFIEMVVTAIIGILIAKQSNIVAIGGGIIDALGTKVLGAIVKSKAGIILALAVLLAAVLDWLGIQVDVLVDSLFKLLIMVINGLSMAIIKNGTFLFKAILNLVSAIASLLLSAFEALIDTIGGWFGVENAAKEWFGLDTVEIFGPTIEALEKDNAELSAALKENGDKLTQDTKLWASKADAAGESYAEGFMGLQDKILSASDSVEINDKLISGESLDKLKEGFLTGAINETNINEYINKLGTDIQEDQGLFSDLGKQVGEWTGTGFSDGIGSMSDLATGSIEDMDFDAIQQMYDDWDINSPSKVSQDIGENIPKGMAKGVEEKTNIVIISMRHLFNAASKVINESSLYTSGKNVTNGFIQGMLSELNLVKSKASQIGKASIDATADAIDAHSPSREFMKLGQYAVEGYAKGMEQNVRLGTDEATSFGDEVLNAFNSVISRIMDAINGDIDMTPVIRPVLDLTEIQNGQARIGSILGTNSYAFNPNMSYGMIHANNVVTAAGNMSLRNGLMDDTLMAMHREMNQINTDNRAIVSVLGRYLPYIPEFSHMQVTLDKKTLVGELTPAIDDALGVRSKRFRG